MNKRISTLMASVLLASAFSANAGDLKVGDFVRLTGTSSKVIGINIDVTSKLPDGNLKLQTAVNGIAVTGVPSIHEKIREAQAQIWKVAKVTITDGGLKCYQFTNKLTNEYLAADLSLATEAGRAIKLSAQGNKDWYVDGNVLYIFNASKDSTYALKEGGADILLTRAKGTNKTNSNAFTPDDNNPPVSIARAEVFNALMSYEGNDGKLHFNGNNVSDGYTNILVDTKWEAVKESGDGSFFLKNGKETSDNKNPYLLMVDHQSYTNTDENFTLTTDTLAVDKNDAASVAGGSYAAGGYMTFGVGQKTETFARPIKAALWTATYSLFNDSLALLPVNVPERSAATSHYIADGFKVAAENASGDMTIAITNLTKGTEIKAVGTNDAVTNSAVDNLVAAVDNWLTAAKVAGASFTNGLNKKFADSYFKASDNSYSVQTGAGYASATDIYGKDLIEKAKIELAGAKPSGVAANDWKDAKDFLDAATYMRRVKIGDVPEKYFERGMAHLPGAAAGGDMVGLVKLLDKNVLTITSNTASNFVETLIQPYVSAPAGDAEITADAKLFFIQVKNTSKLLRATSQTDKYVVSYTNSTKEVVDYVDNANPNAQWVFIPNAAGSYSIINRASEYPLYSGMVQKVKDAAGNVVADTYVIGTDTLKLGAVTVNTNAVYEEKDGDNKVKYDYAGYFYAGPQDGKTMTFGIAPVSPFMSTLAMQVKADSTVVLGEAENAPVWYFKEVPGQAYGVNIAGMPRLKSVAYKVYMKDADGKKYYIVPETTTTNTFVITKEDSPVGSAYAANTTAGLIFRTVAKDTYLISNGTATSDYKMTINSTPEQPIIEATRNSNNLKNDYFTVGKASSNTYRTLTAEDGVNGNAAIYLNNEDSRYLYENSANIVANNGTKFAKDSLNFLGIFNAFELDKNPTVYVDTAYVEREGNIMPQYMFALGVTDVEAHAAIPCTEGGVHIDKDGKPTTADKCVHATPATKGYKAGRYLVVLADSTENNKSAKYDGATRLAFVPAKHYLGEDSLVIDNSKWTGNTNAMKAGEATTWASKDTIKIENGTLKAMTFALEIKDQADKSFYLQTAGGYVRILNGVPVRTSSKDDAAVFNIEASELEATANEAIEAAGVQVIGGQGVVTVQGAAGKVITVADILGRTIANQVAASDNVTIAAPAGVVVVAVDGDATKVVVK